MDHDQEFEREHPSYGVLRIARTSGGSGEIRLFGSPLATHYGTIRLTVSKGRWTHRHHADYNFGMGKEFIDIEMSAAQFADAITSLNLGSGTPCTIRYVDGERVPDPPDHPSEAEHIRDRFEDSIDAFQKKARTYRQRIEALTDKLSAKARQEIKIALDVIEDQLGSNVPFVVKQFQQATTRITTAAKSEVDAFVTGVVRAAGLQSIAEGRLPALLPSRAQREDAEHEGRASQGSASQGSASEGSASPARRPGASQ